MAGVVCRLQVKHGIVEQKEVFPIFFQRSFQTQILPERRLLPEGINRLRMANCLQLIRYAPPYKKQQDSRRNAAGIAKRAPHPAGKCDRNTRQSSNKIAGQKGLGLQLSYSEASQRNTKTEPADGFGRLHFLYGRPSVSRSR